MCTAGFLRLLGVTNSTEISKAPGQWRRLIKGYREGKSEHELLSKDKLELDAGESFTEKEGHASAYILEVAEYFSESLPAVPSENSNVYIKVVPYKSVKDVFSEYQYQCDVALPRVLESNRASYSTFLRAWNKLHDSELVKLLGGKGAFQTCAICNHCIEIKKSAACKREQSTIDVIRKISRMHLLQQQTERQHAENVIHACKTMFVDEQPVQAYIDLDGQTVITGNTPKLSKTRSITLNNYIENRNIGARLVCGPIDCWISISTNNLIPSGANVMIEATKIAIETLGEKLSEIDLIVPKKLSIQYDNSGENKV
jgi:hypothetical protein